MSSSLHWRPVAPEGEQFGDGLKFVLRKHFDEGILDWRPVGRELVPFLQGVVAAGSSDVVREAQRLIDLIEKHGEVEIGEVN